MSERCIPASCLVLASLAALIACSTSGRTEEIAEGEALGKRPPRETVPLPPSAAGGFTDVTAAAGIRVRQTLPTDDLENIVDAVGAGAAFADLDGDGWLDLVVLGGSASPGRNGSARAHTGIRLYRNLRDGRFEDVTARSGVPKSTTAVAIAVGDTDGDGDRDLYLVDRGPNRLFRNDGDFRFDDITRKAGVGDGRFGVGAVFFDIEPDGDLDLYVTNYLEYDPRETAYFGPDGYPGPLTYRAEADVLYRNRGDGTFEDVSSAFGIDRLSGRGMSLAAADFDEDGDTDLFVANDATENFLLINDGGRRFDEIALLAGVAMGENSEQTAAMAANVGDVDGDGHLDLAVSDTAFGALYLFERPGFFIDDVMRSGIGVMSGQYVSWGQNLLDYDNDGDLDLFLANGDLHHLVGWEDLLLRNDGRGRFEDATASGGPYFSTRRVSRGSIVGDYDNDGDLDIFITTLQDQHVLLRNDLESEASWITIDLVGRSARDPFGTRVRVEAGGRTWVSESRCPSGYLGQGDPRLHFGLGEDIETVDRVLFTWPGGNHQALTQIPAGQFLRVEEGSE